jgi:hypothetical protein
MAVDSTRYMEEKGEGDNGQSGESSLNAEGPLSEVRQITEAMRAKPLIIGEIMPSDESVSANVTVIDTASDNHPDDIELDESELEDDNDQAEAAKPVVSPLENKERYRGISVTVPRAGKLTKTILTTTKWKNVYSLMVEFRELAKAEGFDIAVEEDEGELLNRVTLTNQPGNSSPMSKEHQDFIRMFPNSIIAR